MILLPSKFNYRCFDVYHEMMNAFLEYRSIFVERSCGLHYDRATYLDS